MNCVLHDFRMSALSVVTGGREICIDDELEAYGGDQSRIDRLKKATGLRARRVVSKGCTTLDLAEEAVQRLREAGKLDLSEVEACLFVTQTPDHFQPSNAAILHGRLGLEKSVAAWDINLGCSGWIYGLAQAGMLIQVGGAKKVLLVAGDTLSRQVDPEDRGTVPLFGDAACAAVLDFDSGREWRFQLATDGAGSNAIRLPAGGMRTAVENAEPVLDAEGNLHRADCLVMDGAEVFQFALREVPKAVKRVLEDAGTNAEEVHHFFFHQANAYILSNIRRRLKLGAEQVPMQALERYGNLSSASIPSVICDTLNESDGGGGLSVLCGFGVGLSWATALTDLQGVDCLPVKAYGKD